VKRNDETKVRREQISKTGPWISSGNRLTVLHSREPMRLGINSHSKDAIVPPV
jgi:hypothetical protein